ncbi:enoyl-CoA hydratase-related protein [Jhaorihella thermophila]
MARVSVKFDNHIARVTLTRPDKMNALDRDMVQAIPRRWRGGRGHGRPRGGAVGRRQELLRGAGHRQLRGDGGGMNAADWLLERTHEDANEMQELAMPWRRLPIPVIAALHGAVYGGGLQIALGADIRIARPDAKLAVMEMKWGIVPDMGGMVLLPKLVRSDVLRLLTYTAAPIDGEQAERWGLVTRLAEDPLAAAMDLANQIAGKGPNAIRAAKRLIGLAERADQAEVLMAESREQVDLIGKPEQMEVIAAQMQGRKPVFK